MLDDTQIPRAAGLRSLTLEERRQRAEAMACIDPTKKPGMPDCSQTIWVSIFFDGTGNNLILDTPKLKHSNVARLSLTHPRKSESSGQLAIYIPGLGTPYPEIGEYGTSATGLGFGASGEKRIARARFELDAFITKAKARATNPTQPIRMINLALFGFSRGAATARAFAVRLAKECVAKDGGWRYQGYPIRLYFMGLFDTVASSGLSGGLKVIDHSPTLRAGLDSLSLPIGTVLTLASKDGHYAWAHDLRIPRMVEQCVHFVAAHEVRDSFPLDSVRDGEHYPPNTHEVVYPGVHSDVGGGYAPGEQTRSLKDEEKLSQVPLLHMYRAARAAGVPLQALEVLALDVQASFNLSPKAAALFDSYQAAANAEGPLESAFSAHLEKLYIARTYLAKLMEDSAAQGRIPAAEQILKQTGNGDLAAALPNQVALITANGNEMNQATGMAETKKIDGKQLTLREATLALAYEDTSLILATDEERKPMLDFFDYLVHDSVAGFGRDFSKLENWRMMYFGAFAYEPNNDWSLQGASAP